MPQSTLPENTAAASVITELDIPAELYRERGCALLAVSFQRQAGNGLYDVLIRPLEDLRAGADISDAEPLGHIQVRASELDEAQEATENWIGSRVEVFTVVPGIEPGSLLYRVRRA